MGGDRGYHVEHHDFVNIPGKSLPKVHTIANKFYARLLSHQSWTQIFVTFIAEAALSHSSRFVRARDAVFGHHVRTMPNAENLHG